MHPCLFLTFLFHPQPSLPDTATSSYPHAHHYSPTTSATATLITHITSHTTKSHDQWLESKNAKTDRIAPGQLELQVKGVEVSRAANTFQLH